MFQQGESIIRTSSINYDTGQCNENGALNPTLSPFLLLRREFRLLAKSSLPPPFEVCHGGKGNGAMGLGRLCSFAGNGVPTQGGCLAFADPGVSPDHALNRQS